MKSALLFFLLSAGIASAEPQVVNRILNGDFAAPNPDPTRL